MIITRVEPLTKTKFRIYIDGEPVFVLYRGELKRFNIAEEEEISEQTVEKINKDVLLKRAKLRAMHLLEDMDRTEKALRRRRSAEEVSGWSGKRVELMHRGFPFRPGVRLFSGRGKASPRAHSVGVLFPDRRVPERLAFFPPGIEKLILGAHGLNEGKHDGRLLPFPGRVEVLYALHVLVPQGHEGSLVHGVELTGHFEQHVFHCLPRL